MPASAPQMEGARRQASASPLTFAAPAPVTPIVSEIDDPAFFGEIEQALPTHRARRGGRCGAIQRDRGFGDP